MKTKICVLAIFASLLFISSLPVTSTFSETNLHPEPPFDLHKFEREHITEDYTPHAPIVITSNDDFVVQGWSGSGTATDPFVISGLSFSSSINGITIHIQNTTAFFVIRECYINMAGNDFGTIVLERVTNAIIEHSILFYTGIGISLESCSSITIQSSMLNYSVVSIDKSSDITLLNSSIHGGPGNGVSILNSNFVEVKNNRITSVSASGIYLENANNVTISDNYIADNSDYQMQIASGSSNLVYGNTFIGGLLSNCVEDNGHLNQWDDGISKGNAYSDYSGESVYVVPGTAKSLDRFPSGIEITNTTYSYTFPIEIFEPPDPATSVVYAILIVSAIWGVVGIIVWYALKTKIAN